MNPLVSAYVNSMTARDRLANTRVKRDICSLSLERYNLFRDDLDEYAEANPGQVQSWDVYSMVRDSLVKMGRPAGYSDVCENMFEITTTPEITLKAYHILVRSAMSFDQLNTAVDCMAKMTPSMKENLAIILARALGVTLASSKERLDVLVQSAQQFSHN